MRLETDELRGRSRGSGKDLPAKVSAELLKVLEYLPLKTTDDSDFPTDEISTPLLLPFPPFLSARMSRMRRWPSFASTDLHHSDVGDSVKPAARRELICVSFVCPH